MPPAASAVRALKIGGIVAWVGDAPSAKLSRDLRDAARATVEHDRVITSAMTGGPTPIPASLGDPYDSDEAVRSDIAAHSDEIVAAFRFVGDRVEMTTIIAIADQAPPAGSEGRGRAYLEQLRSLPARAMDIADRIQRALAEIGGDAARRPEGGRIAISHLVAREQAGAYRDIARRASGPGYRVVVDGPRAPYSFASFSRGRGIAGKLAIRPA